MQLNRRFKCLCATLHVIFLLLLFFYSCTYKIWKPIFVEIWHIFHYISEITCFSNWNDVFSVRIFVLLLRQRIFCYLKKDSAFYKNPNYVKYKFIFVKYFNLWFNFIICIFFTQLSGIFSFFNNILFKFVFDYISNLL